MSTEVLQAESPASHQPTYKELRKNVEAIAHQNKYQGLVLKALKGHIRQDRDEPLTLVQPDILGGETIRTVERDRSGSVGKLVRNEGAASPVAFSLRIPQYWTAKLARYGYKVEVVVGRNDFAVKTGSLSIRHSLTKALNDIVKGDRTFESLVAQIEAAEGVHGLKCGYDCRKVRRDLKPTMVSYRFTYTATFRPCKHSPKLWLTIFATHFTLEGGVESPAFRAIVQSLEECLELPFKLVREMKIRGVQLPGLDELPLLGIENQN